MYLSMKVTGENALSSFSEMESGPRELNEVEKELTVNKVKQSMITELYQYIGTLLPTNDRQNTAEQYAKRTQHTGCARE